MADTQSKVTVRTSKFGGVSGKTWQCNFFGETDEILTLIGVFGKEVNHKFLGRIKPETTSIEYYWKREWFNVFAFFEPDTSFRNFYCNISSPPIFENNTLNYVDFDIDVLVHKDLSYEILDMDEYEENAAGLCYSDELKSKVQDGLEKLISMIKAREFPFVENSQLIFVSDV